MLSTQFKAAGTRIHSVSQIYNLVTSSEVHIMFVIKRDGRKEQVHFDKITARIMKLSYGLNTDFCDPVSTIDPISPCPLPDIPPFVFLSRKKPLQGMQ